MFCKSRIDNTQPPGLCKCAMSPLSFKTTVITANNNSVSSPVGSTFFYVCLFCFIHCVSMCVYQQYFYSIANFQRLANTNNKIQKANKHNQKAHITQKCIPMILFSKMPHVNGNK